MLKDHFFTIEEKTQTPKEWEYRISLDASHPIYQAHFPKNPVTPGVCIIQMIKEIASDCCSKVFFIRIIKNVKFLSVLNPLLNKEVLVRFTCKLNENGWYVVSAVISKDGLIFSKVNLHLEEVGEANG